MDTAKAAIKDDFMFTMAFGFIGAKGTAFTVLMKQDERLRFKFSEHGVPLGSKLLGLIYTAQGPGLSPGELCGNMPTRRIMGDEVTIFPIRFADDEPKETRLAVMVTWVPSSSADDSWQSLVDASRRTVSIG